MTPAPTEPRFIVKTRIGFFVRWVSDNIAHINAERSTALQMSSDEADTAVSKLNGLGFDAVKMEITP